MKLMPESNNKPRKNLIKTGEDLNLSAGVGTTSENAVKAWLKAMALSRLSIIHPANENELKDLATTMRASARGTRKK